MESDIFQMIVDDICLSICIICMHLAYLCIDSSVHSHTSGQVPFNKCGVVVVFVSNMDFYLDLVQFLKGKNISREGFKIEIAYQFIIWLLGYFVDPVCWLKTFDCKGVQATHLSVKSLVKSDDSSVLIISAYSKHSVIIPI